MALRFCRPRRTASSLATVYGDHLRGQAFFKRSSCGLVESLTTQMITDEPSTSAEARASEARKQDISNELCHGLLVFLIKQGSCEIQASLEVRQNSCRSSLVRVTRELFTLSRALRDRPKPQRRMTLPQNLDQMVLRYMGISLCCCDRRMSQEFLDHSNVYAVA